MKFRQRGFSLVETLVAFAIFATTIVGLLYVATRSLGVGRVALIQTRAHYVLEEGYEALRHMRDSNWSNIANLTLDNEYSLEFKPSATSTWMATTSDNLVDGLFDRSFVVSQAFRDGSNKLSSSGSNEPDVRKIYLSVKYKNTSGATTTTSLTFYLANVFLQ